MPSRVPAWFTTGKRRTCPSRMVFNAEWISSSGWHACVWPEVTSRTRNSDASLFLVPSATQMSRSVIMPVTLPASPTTGSVPQSLSHISAAAAARFVSGRQNTTDFVIKSRTLMSGLLSQNRNENLLIDQLRLPAIREHEHNTVPAGRWKLGDPKSDPIIALFDNLSQCV